MMTVLDFGNKFELNFPSLLLPSNKSTLYKTTNAQSILKTSYKTVIPIHIPSMHKKAESNLLSQINDIKCFVSKTFNEV